MTEITRLECWGVIVNGMAIKARTITQFPPSDSNSAPPISTAETCSIVGGLNAEGRNKESTERRAERRMAPEADSK